MPETPGPAEHQQSEEAEAEGCPVEMYAGRCGRLLYFAPAGVDERPVCLMHSTDRNKSNEAFQQEIKHILEEAGDGVADFTRFVFPSARYGGRKFKARCIFFEARFTQADFSAATFTQRADFRAATFTQEADFVEATFTQEADFIRATFTQRPNFPQRAKFSKATFTRRAYFIDATFTQEAEFIGAKFSQEAKFFGATFTQEANFSFATFAQSADFTEATLEKEANFGWATFSAAAWFRETKFRNDGQGIGPIFSRARFEKPERVEFYQTDLGQALFHNCDVSRVVFSNVEWRTRKNGKRMVFEEVVSLEPWAAKALKAPKGSGDDLNYGLIAELYQQLKKNFDDRRDYWTAGDFHWGEMEMKRLSSRRRNRVLRWLKQTLGFTALYKHASEYGESYGRPFRWLLIILVLFALAYPDAGLRPATEGTPSASGQSSTSAVASPEIHYENFFQYRMAHPKGVWWGTGAFFGHSLMTALSVMALQRELEYQPVYPWGRPLLTVLELVLSYTLIALFLLAVRRQFRR